MPRMKILQKPGKPVPKRQRERIEQGAVKITLGPRPRREKKEPAPSPREVSELRRAARAKERAEKRASGAESVKALSSKEFTDAGPRPKKAPWDQE
jgi:hypothetical protein